MWSHSFISFSRIAPTELIEPYAPWWKYVPRSKSRRILARSVLRRPPGRRALTPLLGIDVSVRPLNTKSLGSLPPVKPSPRANGSRLSRTAITPSRLGLGHTEAFCQQRAFPFRAPHRKFGHSPH